ncbi:hypothetical protein KBB17_03270 [Candidatus Saccharibacteria bacterium]|nr:hypothetical protein [Candidatus Saccharibacteria bacterium]
MTDFNRVSSFMILVVAVLIQSIVFNRYQVYAVNLQFAWIIFFALIAYLPNSSLPLIGTFLGYALSIFSNSSPVLGAAFGLLIGIISMYLAQNVIWSLSWIRTVFLMLVLIVLQLPSLVSQASPAKMYMYFLFLVINTIVAMIIFTLTQSRLKYE